jgi:MFS family permease
MLMAERRRKIYYGWWIVACSALILSIGLGLSLYTFPIFYPALIHHFGWSRGEVVTGGALLMVVLGAMSPFTGALLDRYGAKTILAAGLITVGAALFTFPLIHSLGQFYGACILLGLGLCGVSHMPNQVLVANWFVERRGLAVGLVSAGVGVGGAVGPLLVTSLIDHYGWRAGFVGIGVAVWAIPFVLVLLVIKSRPQDMGLVPYGQPVLPDQNHDIETNPLITSCEATLTVTMRTSPFWILFGAIFLISALMYTVNQHLFIYLRDQGFASQLAARALSLILGTMAVGKIVFGALSDRFNRRNVMLASFLLVAGSSLSLLVALRPSIIYMFAAVFGLGFGGIFSCMPVIAAHYFGLRSLGKILGLIFLSFNLGGSLWPIVTGYLFDRLGNYDLIFRLNPIIGFVAVGAVLLLPREWSTGSG